MSMAEHARCDDIALVVHPGVAERHISLNRVRAYFFHRLRQWSDGSPVKVFVLTASDSIHSTFIKSVLGVHPFQLEKAWERHVFAGLGTAPARVDSIGEMRKRVAGTPGAIGYLPQDEIDESVRLLQIER